MPTPLPKPVPVANITPVGPRVQSTAPAPVTPGPGVTVPPTPAPVPVSSIDTKPANVTPGVGTPSTIPASSTPPVPVKPPSATGNIANITANVISNVSIGGGNVPVNTGVKAGGIQYQIQYNGGNGIFSGASNFEFDPVNRMVRIGNAIAASESPPKTTDLLLQGNFIIGEIISATGKTPFGTGYAEIGRIRYLDDAGYPNARYPSVYGFRSQTYPLYENWMCIINEPGHETNTSTAVVLGLGAGNGNSTLFGVSVNSTNPRGTNATSIYSEPSTSGWAKLLNLTGQDLFLPQLTEAVGPKFLAYEPGNGRVTYTTGSGGGAIAVQDEGTNVVASTNTINFVGSGVTASNVSGVATITIPSSSGITVKEEGTNVVTSANTLNFVGSSVTASNVGGVATITITNTGSGIGVQDEGTNVVTSASTVNFVGAGVTASNVGGVATITIPGGGNGSPAGNVGEVQFNGGGNFSANSNFLYNNGGVFVGGIGNNTANATGIVSAISEFRVGLWELNSTPYGDRWGRIRMGQDARVKSDPYYGFDADPSINPVSGIAARTLVITNEELEYKQAMVLMDGSTYPANTSNQGTIFGISGIDVSYANSSQPTTGTEPGWRKFIDVTNTGNTRIGGSLIISPGFQPTPPGNTQVGIRFADGTFQYTAAGVSGITVQDEGSNVVATASTVNFVGAGVTTSNVGGVATVTIPGGGSGITVQDEGSNVVATASTINFVGSGVAATNVAGVATVTVSSGGISGIAVQEEGSNVVATANTMNFVGAGVTASNVGGVATVTIPSGIAVQEEGSNVVTGANTLNFVGSSVTASNVGGVATVTVTSTSGDTVYDKGNVSGATTINISDGTIQLCTLTGNTVFNISSVTVGKSLTLILTQGTGGNKLATYGNTVYWAAGYKTLSSAAGAIDMVNFVNLGSVFAATLTTGYTT